MDKQGEQFIKKFDRNTANNAIKRNGSGYYDPTAYQVLRDMEAEERYKKVLGCILRICELSDFYVEERLVLKDKRTGRVWR